MDTGIWIIIVIAVFAGGYLLRMFLAHLALTRAEQRAKQVIEEAKKDAEATRREGIIETKDAILKERNKFDNETRERRNEIKRLEDRILSKEENLDRRLLGLEKREKTVQQREQAAEEKISQLEDERAKVQKTLEVMSGMTVEQAREMLINDLREEARLEGGKYVNKIESEARQNAEKKAREIIITAVQHCVPELVGEATVSSVSLPSDEMKGRIIGREGRNIRVLEVLTGVDIIIDDTPEAVVLSCFNPINREIARLSLERLITDGRIHPAMIEEVVTKVRRDVDKVIIEEGERTIFDLGLHSMHPELVKAIGRLKYRTSYGQNILNHSRAVANISGMLAGEVGADVQKAIRGGMLHDIGKGTEIEGGGGHALIGADLARMYGEDDDIVNIIASHHGDKEATCLEAVLVTAADAISAARPGARKESLEGYIKRLENLEKIANDFKGVEKSFAIQAGRELRVMVHNELVDDEAARQLARDIAKRIEREIKHPGVIKITVIRETRIIEHAY
ncbi:MAG: ribonuclease Y [Spirochaetota bacterium]|jgi:ribonuclease Y|nr:ribonuclease Y [Spirochaetota bacterium]